MTMVLNVTIVYQKSLLLILAWTDADSVLSLLLSLY